MGDVVGEEEGCLVLTPTHHSPAPFLSLSEAVWFSYSVKKINNDKLKIIEKVRIISINLGQFSGSHTKL